MSGQFFSTVLICHSGQRYLLSHLASPGSECSLYCIPPSQVPGVCHMTSLLLSHDLTTVVT